jgi:hypothetical protein
VKNFNCGFFVTPLFIAFNMTIKKSCQAKTRRGLKNTSLISQISRNDYTDFPPPMPPLNGGRIEVGADMDSSPLTPAPAYRQAGSPARGEGDSWAILGNFK